MSDLQSKSEAVPSRELAARIGQSHTIVQRKRRQGKSDDQIVAEAAGEPVASPDGNETYANAQRRKEAALADLRELERDQLNGRLVEVETEERAWASAAQTIRDQMLALPDRLAPELAAITDTRMLRDKLQAEIRQVLADLPEKIARAA